ncbi:uncharacterized protein LOC124268912 [Haliotis rubra]|uniref:uncharacterized protein LOC124268912 n=1 Tax=Haliotis rubra TaxID=36100 RepID=UPI001EE58565|nr:uncharacterized protein LOC124268912 [Haliotis rubra]
MVDKHLKTNPPSEYEVGEIVLVRHLGKDKGVARDGQKITSRKAVGGEILQVDNKLHKYKVNGTPLNQFVCTQQSWEDYLSTMEAPGTWGDHLVLLGAAEFLQADIEVITTASETHPVTIKAVNRQDKTKKLFLGHIAEFYYVSLNELGQICRDCHLELSVCQCVDNINASDTRSSPPGYGSEEDTVPESNNIHLPETMQVSKAFFQKEEDNLVTYLRNLIQGNFR